MHQFTLKFSLLSSCIYVCNKTYILPFDLAITIYPISLPIDLACIYKNVPTGYNDSYLVSGRGEFTIEPLAKRSLRTHGDIMSDVVYVYRAYIVAAFVG